MSPNGVAARALPGVLLARLICTSSHAATAPAQPKATEISYIYDIFDHSLPRPIAPARSRPVDPPDQRQPA